MTTAGPNLPGSATTNAGAGTLAWSNPTNIETDGGGTTASSATATASNSAADTVYLVGSNFGFAIPAGAIINGVTVTVTRSSNTATNVKDKVVQLAPAGTLGGTNKANTGTAWGTTFTSPTYGGTSDLWGLTLGASDLNNSAFAVYLQATISFAFDAAYVDCIKVTVTYTAVTTSARSIAPTAGLKATVSRTVAAAAALKASPARSVAPTAALKATLARTVAPTAGLKATHIRTLASSLFLQPIRRLAVSIGLRRTVTRQITPSLLLAYHEITPLLAPSGSGVTRAIPLGSTQALVGGDGATAASDDGPVHAVLTGNGATNARFS